MHSMYKTNPCTWLVARPLRSAIGIRGIRTWTQFGLLMLGSRITFHAETLGAMVAGEDEAPAESSSSRATLTEHVSSGNDTACRGACSDALEDRSSWVITMVEKSVKSYIEWCSQRTRKLDFGPRYHDIMII